MISRPVAGENVSVVNCCGRRPPMTWPPALGRRRRVGQRGRAGVEAVDGGAADGDVLARQGPLSKTPAREVSIDTRARQVGGPERRYSVLGPACSRSSAS